MKLVFGAGRLGVATGSDRRVHRSMRLRVTFFFNTETDCKPPPGWCSCDRSPPSPPPPPLPPSPPPPLSSPPDGFTQADVDAARVEGKREVCAMARRDEFRIWGEVCCGPNPAWPGVPWDECAEFDFQCQLHPGQCCKPIMQVNHGPGCCEVWGHGCK